MCSKQSTVFIFHLSGQKSVQHSVECSKNTMNTFFFHLFCFQTLERAPRTRTAINNRNNMFIYILLHTCTKRQKADGSFCCNSINSEFVGSLEVVLIMTLMNKDQYLFYIYFLTLTHTDLPSTAHFSSSFSSIQMIV